MECPLAMEAIIEERQYKETPIANKAHISPESEVIHKLMWIIIS